MDLLEEAKSKLHESDASLVALKNGEVRISHKKGIAPIMTLLEEDAEFLRGAYVADRIIGKAAALLLIHAGIERLYARTISEHAVQALDDHFMSYEYDKLVPHIINREGTGICPMEKLVLEISEPGEAYERLRESLQV